LIVEVNAKQFIDWLLQLPSKKLMKPLEANKVVAVGRRLAELEASVGSTRANDKA
jgi:hypothetical protein